LCSSPKTLCIAANFFQFLPLAMCPLELFPNQIKHKFLELFQSQIDQRKENKKIEVREVRHSFPLQWRV
jgi:hypothetical protein